MMDLHPQMTDDRIALQGRSGYSGTLLKYLLGFIYKQITGVCDYCLMSPISMADEFMKHNLVYTENDREHGDGVKCTRDTGTSNIK